MAIRRLWRYYLIVHILLLVENSSHFVRVAVETRLNERRLHNNNDNNDYTSTEVSRLQQQRRTAYYSVDVGAGAAHKMPDGTDAVTEARSDQGRRVGERAVRRTVANLDRHHPTAVVHLRVLHAARHRRRQARAPRKHRVDFSWPTVSKSRFNPLQRSNKPIYRSSAPSTLRWWWSIISTYTAVLRPVL